MILWFGWVGPLLISPELSHVTPASAGRAAGGRCWHRGEFQFSSGGLILHEANVASSPVRLGAAFPGSGGRSCKVPWGFHSGSPATSLPSISIVSTSPKASPDSHREWLMSWWNEGQRSFVCLFVTFNLSHLFFLFFFLKSFIYLAAPGLNCSMWDLVPCCCCC